MSDHLAGRRVACRACGATFRVPGTMPEMVFFPAGDPATPSGPADILVAGRDDPTRLAPGLARRRAHPLATAVRAVVYGGAGLVAAAVAVAMVASGDLGVGGVDADSAAPLAMGLSGLVAGFVLPIVIPVTLSRRRRLSVGRWVAMAAFCACLVPVGGFVLGVGDELTARGQASHAKDFRFLGLALAVPAGVAVAGCLLAAAVHPKGSR